MTELFGHECVSHFLCEQTGLEVKECQHCQTRTGDQRQSLERGCVLYAQRYAVLGVHGSKLSVNSQAGHRPPESNASFQTENGVDINAP